MVGPSIVALIPARAGSKRVPNKAIRNLGGKPLIVWTIEAAKGSGIFDTVMVCSDSKQCKEIAQKHKVGFIHRSDVPDDQPDIDWVSHALMRLNKYDAFAILRPTSPFRAPGTIRRAWEQFLGEQPCDSLRAVEPVKQHPGKMWVLRGGRLLALLPWERGPNPWHSSPTQTLPRVYVQNASLEIAWCRTVNEQGSIAGANILPFFTQAYEGFDINTEADFAEAERLLREGKVCN